MAEPVRPGLDDNQELAELVRLWRESSADIDSRVQAVWREMRREIRWVGEGTNRAVRLEAQLSRLREVQAVAEHQLDDLIVRTGGFLSDGPMASIYSAGADLTGRGFSFTQPHRAAVEALARDAYRDVLAATEFVDADAKAWVRRVSRQVSGFKITSGDTARQAAARFERELSREFRARGIGAVTYANGSKHSFGEYAEMLLRTKTGVAYNAGTLNQSRLVGIQWFELLDGSNCGLTAHHDPDLANGKIVPFYIAEAYPLSHPNCRRAIVPRPDLTGPVGESVQSVEARADQTAFEEALRAQQAARGRSGRRERRARRQRPTAADRARETARQRARAERLARAERVQAARDEVIRERAGRVAAERNGVADGRRPSAAQLDRWGITEDQWVNARAVVADVKRDIRQTAAQEADNLGAWLSDSSLDQISRPSRLRQTTDIVSGRRRSVRDDAGFDFLEGLSDAELARVRRRYADTDLFSPDLLSDQVRRVTNLDMSDSEAMDWLVDRWLQEDGLRSLASGRVPRYANPENLIPSDYALDGYEIGRLFGVDVDEAAAHIAQVQAEAAEQYAARVLGRPSLGPAPWEMDAADFVRELERIEDTIGRATAETPAAPSVLARFRELAPVEIDDGDMSPLELFERVRLVAQQAGYPTP